MSLWWIPYPFRMYRAEIDPRPVLVAIAVRIGSTRLIDNFSYDVEK